MISVVLLIAADEYSEKFTNYNLERTIETFQIAQEYYTRQLETDPEDYQSALLLAYMHLIELNNFVLILDQNLDDLPNNVKFQFANLLLSLNQFEESLKIYNELTSKLPNWSCGWRHQGEAYFLKGDFEEAENSFMQSIRTRETHWDAYIWLAKAQREMGKYKYALETFIKGQTFYGKDIEDPDEKFAPEEIAFLHLGLLKLNDRLDEFNELKRVLTQEYPDSSFWELFD